MSVGREMIQQAARVMNLRNAVVRFIASGHSELVGAEGNAVFVVDVAYLEELKAAVKASEPKAPLAQESGR
jgi:hypothetical protein